MDETSESSPYSEMEEEEDDDGSDPDFTMTPSSSSTTSSSASARAAAAAARGVILGNGGRKTSSSSSSSSTATTMAGTTTMPTTPGRNSSSHFSPRPSIATTMTIVVAGEVVVVERKRLQCEFAGCDRSFLRSEHLRRHERVHTGHRPHVCGVCGKTFSRSDNLREHHAVHQRVKGAAVLPAAAAPLPRSLAVTSLPTIRVHSSGEEVNHLRQLVMGSRIMKKSVTQERRTRETLISSTTSTSSTPTGPMLSMIPIAGGMPLPGVLDPNRRSSLLSNILN